MGDGHSWLVLGNAYLAAFFTVEAKMESLKHCKAAYSKAVCMGALGDRVTGVQ